MAAKDEEKLGNKAGQKIEPSGVGQLNTYFLASCVGEHLGCSPCGKLAVSYRNSLD